MTSKVTIRFLSGRVEEYEVEIYGGGSVESRLEEFCKDPTIVLHVGKEVVIIPATAIETIGFPLPDAMGPTSGLRNVRKAKRLK
jgi:hypothetical protein